MTGENQSSIVCCVFLVLVRHKLQPSAQFIVLLSFCLIWLHFLTTFSLDNTNAVSVYHTILLNIKTHVLYVYILGSIDKVKDCIDVPLLCHGYGEIKQCYFSGYSGCINISDKNVLLLQFRI